LYEPQNFPDCLAAQDVYLRRTRDEDAEHLSRIAELSTFQHYVSVRPRSVDPDGFRAYFDLLRQAGSVVPYTVWSGTGDVLGMSCFYGLSPEHRSVEIGFTWYSAAVRGTQVNPSSKLAMLSHAFETMQTIRVQLQCDGRNLTSQRAIEKLGATREGVLRRKGILPDGTYRDTVIFSILDFEWPRVKAGLLARIKP
jgi:RimJ/RimL family protein N-acetyltransferase